MKTKERIDLIDVAGKSFQDRLESLGMKRAAKEFRENLPLLRKMLVAKEHYRFVTEENYERAQEELRAKSIKKTRVDMDGYYEEVTTWVEMVLVQISEYDAIPPVHVLDSLEKAKELGCFDYFDIAKLERMESRRKIVKKVPEPILFGRINGSKMLFYIDQWGDDISIEEILRPLEG